jgi:rare lipoprotein A
LLESRLLKIFIILPTIIFLNNCAPSSRFSARSSNNKHSTRSDYSTGDVFYGESSYYADKFHGKKTANGEIFDMYKKTAAHKTLPFDTILEVTNLENNQSVVVRINDRGPFIGDRIIDLSYGAAKEIDMISSGVVEVKIKILKWGG